MSTKKKIKSTEKKKRHEREILDATSLVIPDPVVNSHAIRILGKEIISINCSSTDDWIDLSPVSFLEKDIQFCPRCGTKLELNIVCDKFNIMMRRSFPSQPQIHS